MDDLFKLMPDSLKQRLATHGLQKVASTMYNVEKIDEATAARIIGEKLASRRATNREINLGLVMLKSLEQK
jgi:hypothetical protein